MVLALVGLAGRAAGADHAVPHRHRTLDRPLGGGNELTVNSTGDGSDAAAGDGQCADAVGSCTLRAAIEEANALPGMNVILFRIDRGPKTIIPATALPAITDPILLNGATQPGFLGTPIIELDDHAPSV